MRKLYFIFCLFLMVVSCKESKPNIQSITGLYVSEIKKDVITFDTGLEYDLEAGSDAYVYYLVRHAEKDTIPTNDPRLTDFGISRASKLYDILKGTRLDGIYSTLFMRTLETVDSIASAKGVSIKPYDPSGFKDLHKMIVDSTSSKRILISGHSNTTPVLANYLSGTNFFTQSFDESDYDNFLIVVDRGDAGKDLIPLKYKPE